MKFILCAVLFLFSTQSFAAECFNLDGDHIASVNNTLFPITVKYSRAKNGYEYDVDYLNGNHAKGLWIADGKEHEIKLGGFKSASRSINCDAGRLRLVVSTVADKEDGVRCVSNGYIYPDGRVNAIYITFHQSVPKPNPSDWEHDCTGL